MEYVKKFMEPIMTAITAVSVPSVMLYLNLIQPWIWLVAFVMVLIMAVTNALIRVGGLRRYTRNHAACADAQIAANQAAAAKSELEREQTEKQKRQLLDQERLDLEKWFHEMCTYAKKNLKGDALTKRIQTLTKEYENRMAQIITRSSAKIT